MVSRNLMLGISALALFAGTGANAQTNTSEISQTGSNNLADVVNAEPATNEFNASVVIQNGNDNTTIVRQVGDLNDSNAQQIGDANVIVHTQNGDGHRAESIQDGEVDYSAIRQRGDFNQASVSQRGDRNLSRVAQGVDASASTNYDMTSFFNPTVGVVRAGNENRATVSQVGDDFASTIRQRARAGGPAASDNTARVRQRGQGSLSDITQESRGNTADVFQFEGGGSVAMRNMTRITQQDLAATTPSNPRSNNVVNVSVSGQSNSSTVLQNGRNNNAELTQGLGVANVAQVSQVGDLGANRAGVAQYGDNNAVTISQNSVNARAVAWQQAGPAGARSSNNAVEIQQGTGTTGTTPFSAAFFGNTAPFGAATRNLTADVTQGNNPAAASWNVAQVRQDGIDLSATVRQSGSGTQELPNIVRVAQQGGSAGSNSATAIQGPGVGPSSAADAAPTGQSADEYYFAGGARSAEINILQSGSSNSATVEQRGRGQFARIEQGPGSGNTASILQDVGATNATAIIRQTGNNNSYNVTQTEAYQYIRVTQTGNNNEVTDAVRRGPGS